MSRPPREKKQTYWRLVARQYRKKKMAVLALLVLGLLGLIAVGAPFLAEEKPIYMVADGKTYWFPNLYEYDDLLYFRFDLWEPGEGERAVMPIVPYPPQRTSLRERLNPPGAKHWLGTDDSGRDVLSRLIWGTRVSMSIGFISVGISMLVGVVVGAAAGYYRGWVDSVAQRIIEIILCFPALILILSVRVFLPPHIFFVMLVLGLTRWPDIARLVRGEFLKLRDSDFAMAARASGYGDGRIIFKHLLPNAMAPVLVSATFGVAGAILIESALSFLGFGVAPPTASWGELLSQSKRYIEQAWWLVVYPGAMIFITVTAFNLVGEGLRDAMDPRLRQ